MSQSDPSNGEIMTEVMNLREDLKKIDDRLVPLERWKIAFDAADAAIIKYKQEHGEASDAALGIRARPAPFADGINKEFVNVVLKFLGIVATLLTIVYFILQQVFSK